MLRNSSLRNLILMWLLWAVVIVSFQAIADWRYQPDRPDRALDWTPDWTARNSHRGNVYLTEPFMNQQISMDSEYYLSIAVAGYDDPVGRTTNPIPGHGEIPLNYAFFPLYPFVTRAVAIPLSVFGQSPVGTAALAGVLVSLLGTLAAVIAFYDLVKDQMGEDGALRTVFYFLIFPTSFFLAQIYTEGLFLGLALSSLAMLRRKQFLIAAVLAGLAVWAKAIGLGLLAPLGIVWLYEVWTWWKSRNAPAETEQKGLNPALKTVILHGAYLLIPLAAYLIWHLALGEKAFLVEENWFGRGLFNFDDFLGGVDRMFESFREGKNTQMMIYYLMEIVTVVLSLVACVFTLKRYPGVALFSLLALLVPVTGSAPQSIIRYALAIPSLFIFLAQMGRNTAFDRAWTVFSLLLMGMQTALFTFDMWVA